MQQNFAASLALVLQSEGGYVNDPRDPGGATNKGITQRVYDAWRKSVGKTIGSVKFIAADEVSGIYKRQYWDAVRGDDLPSGIDYLLFDEAVNSGPLQSIKDAQKALGVAVDGHFGLVTLQKVMGGNPRAIIDKTCDYRLSFLRRLATWKFFGPGWSNRVAAVRAAAIKMAPLARGL